MKITNTTSWSTADLRRIFARVLKENCKVEGPFASRRLRIKVKQVKHGTGWTGVAWLGTGSMILRLPRKEIDVHEVGYLFEHELMHCRGYKHENMGQMNSHRNLAERYAYLAGFSISTAAPKPKRPKPDVVDVRYQRTLAALKRWETKRRRAVTALKQLRARQRYYERKRAISPASDDIRASI